LSIAEAGIGIAGSADLSPAGIPRSGDDSPARRLLLALSRFDSVPPELYIERSSGECLLLGDSPDFAFQDAIPLVGAVLPRAENAALLLTDMTAATGLRRTSARKALERLLMERRAARAGAGTRASTYRYWLGRE
jgi:hypothetical protein